MDNSKPSRPISRHDTSIKSVSMELDISSTNQLQESDKSTRDREKIKEVKKMSRKDFEKYLDNVICKKSFDEIRKQITPYQLCKCEMNCLEKSLEVSYKLRKRARGPDAEDFEQMGATVEDFAFHFLDPLKKYLYDLRDLLKTDEDTSFILIGQDFDRVINKAVDLKQMKFLSHPVMYTLQKKRWNGSFYQIRSRSPFIWLLLNLWTMCDVWLFFLVYPLLLLIYIITVNCCKTGKNQWSPFEAYLEYFTTPYFIYVRDTINYLVLLGLHYAMCLQRPSIDINWIEWIILVFFLGRLLMEINQLVSGMTQDDRNSSVSKPVSDNKGQTKRGTPNIMMKMMSRYVGDWWNVLDAISLVIFIVITVLRLSSSRNVIAAVAYLYGINTILLTIRVFGRIMESQEFTGPIQIALFHIISAVVVISGQFLVILLAFSFAITKTYLAGESIRNAMPRIDDRNVTSFDVWWSSFRDLTWSLLGNEEHDSVISPHQTSEIFAKVLYGIFLIMGAVMLLNMLIALLSSTYQKVEDNAFYEWSYKNAITIRTYCNYHLVPVPFNIVSLLLKFIRYIYRKLTNYDKCEVNISDNTNNPKKFFKEIIVYLQTEYFSVHGYTFPKTDGEKINDLVRETKGCRQLMGNIASRVFEYNFEEKQHGAHTYETDKWRYKGIKIDGQRISYMDCDCHASACGLAEYNGGVLRQPLTADWPKFEVLIQECAELRFIAIGLVDANWDPHDVPGSKGNSVGYCVQEGKIFDKQNSKKGKSVKDSSANRGDIIGCELMYEKPSSDGIPVHFTLNGKVIGDGLLKTEDEDGIPFEFHPFVGIGFEGFTLLFRMRSKEPIPCGLEDTKGLIIGLQQRVDFLINDIHKKIDTRF